MSTENKRFHRLQINGGDYHASIQFLERELYIDNESGLLYYGQKIGNTVHPTTVRTVFSKRLVGSGERAVILDGDSNFNKFNIDGDAFKYDFNTKALSASKIEGSTLKYDAIIPKVYEDRQALLNDVSNGKLSEGQLVFVKVGVNIE